MSSCVRELISSAAWLPSFMVQIESRIYSRNYVQQTLRKLGTRHHGLTLSKNSFFPRKNGLPQDRMTVQNEASTKADMAEEHISSYCSKETVVAFVYSTIDKQRVLGRRNKCAPQLYILEFFTTERRNNSPFNIILPSTVPLVNSYMYTVLTIFRSKLWPRDRLLLLIILEDL